jgi:hypothetical protein
MVKRRKSRLVFKNKKGGFQPDRGWRTAIFGAEIELHGVFELFAGFEFDYIAGLDFDRLTRLRVAAFAGFLAGFHKGAESHKGYLAVLLLQGFGNIGHE